MTLDTKIDIGQSLFEVVIALAVVALIIVGLVILSTDSIKNSTFSKNKTLASRYTQEAVEWLRGERDRDVSNFRSKTTTPTYCLDDLDWSNVGICSESEVLIDTPFRREVTFSTSTANNTKGEVVAIINASVLVYWQDSQGLHQVKSVTDFTDSRQY